MKEPPPTPAWEPVAIIAAIIALAPKILAYAKGRTWLFADVLMWAALVLMIAVFVCKAKRFRHLYRGGEKD